MPIGTFLAEPIVGCGGQVVPPDGYLRRAFDAARAGGAVCIADEVQAGFGRVGPALWAFAAQGASPDIVTLGKPIGNRHPLAAVVTTREIAESFANGMEFFSTFGGNPVSCAVGLAVLDVIEDERLPQHAEEVGRLFVAGLEELKSRHPVIADVRGLGLYLGAEFIEPGTNGAAASVLESVIERCRGTGILMSSDGPLHNVLKIKPPLVISESDVRLYLAVLDRALLELAQ